MRKPLLADPPDNPRHRELWLNHAIGYMLTRDVRDYAIAEIEPSLSEEARSAARKGIDDALYGLMMVLDGVPEALTNERYSVELKSYLVLHDHIKNEEAVRTDSFEGFCMGYHYWIEGDFGEDAVVTENEQ